MTIQRLEYLLAIVKHGSITKAANKLFVSQPALSKAIQQLEKEYNITIFNRSNHGVELTQAGRSFVYFAKNTLASVKVLDELSSRFDPHKSLLSVASVQVDFLYDLLIEIYNECYSSPINFNVIETNRGEVIKAVLSGEADIGLTVGTNVDSVMFNQYAKSRTLEVFTIESAQPKIALGPKSPFYNRSEITYFDVQDCCNVVINMESTARTESVFTTCHRFNRNKIIFLDSISACEKFLIETDVFQFIPSWVEKSFTDPRIRVLPISFKKSDTDYTNHLQLILRCGFPLTEPEISFVKKLYKHFLKTPPIEVQNLIIATSLVESI